MTAVMKSTVKVLLSLVVHGFIHGIFTYGSMNSASLTVHLHTVFHIFSSERTNLILYCINVRLGGFQLARRKVTFLILMFSEALKS